MAAGTQHAQGAVTIQPHRAESLSKVSGRGQERSTCHLRHVQRLSCREWGTPEDLVREALGANST